MSDEEVGNYNYDLLNYIIQTCGYIHSIYIGRL